MIYIYIHIIQLYILSDMIPLSSMSDCKQIVNIISCNCEEVVLLLLLLLLLLFSLLLLFLFLLC